MHGDKIEVEPTLKKVEPKREEPRRVGAFAQLNIMKTKPSEEVKEPADEPTALLAEDQIEEA